MDGMTRGTQSERWARPRRAARVALVVATAALWLTGCMVEPVGRVEILAENAESNVVSPPGNTEDRLFRVRAEYAFGESAPSSIMSSSSSTSESKTYIHRNRSTVRQGRVVRLTSLWRVLFFAAWALVGVALFVVGVSLGAASTPDQKGVPPERGSPELILFPLLALVALVALLGFMGYLSGPKYVIDNADGPCVVRINGREVTELGASSFIVTRIGGASFDIEIERPDGAMERARVWHDRNFGQLLQRVYFGRGTFVYNAWGLNSYRLGTANYYR
jgi:hypothetical protein